MRSFENQCYNGCAERREVPLLGYQDVFWILFITDLNYHLVPERDFLMFLYLFITVACRVHTWGMFELGVAKLSLKGG